MKDLLYISSIYLIYTIVTYISVFSIIAFVNHYSTPQETKKKVKRVINRKYKNIA